MSIFGAMQSGISGLAAQSSAMGAISDNIVNVNTVGYKGANTSFQTLVTKQTSTSRYSPGGVQPSAKQGVNVQGLLASVSSSTSMGRATLLSTRRPTPEKVICGPIPAPETLTLITTAI